MFSQANTVSTGSLSTADVELQPSNAKGSPLPPPRLLIPDQSKRRSASVPGAVTPTSSDLPRASRSISKPVVSQKDQENTGRWSEEEHQVFLDGLEQHGKQWKLIAAMIGTRTVVQVRTHAQKYFQKMERSGNKEVASTVHHVMSKRKSLPAALPSRKKMKTRRSPIHRSASISLATTTIHQPTSPVPDL